MEFLLNRFRNLTVLLVVVMAQLLLLAYQVKGSQDVRLIRMWSVTAVTPLAKVLEVVRRNTIGIVEDYFVLINVREENRRLADELGKMKMENHFLKSELQTADRAQALRAFQARTPSRTIPARIIGTGTGANSRVVYVDRGSGAGIERGMAVVTPEGIVGKVLDSYPTASQVLLITDPSFAAGVISQKNRVHGTIKGLGQSKCLVDYVQNEENVESGEMFYTSGDDRIFPKGMPVGRVTVVRQGKTFKEIYVVPNGFQNGLEEVLIVVQGEHQAIPDQVETASSTEMYMMNPPPQSAAAAGAAPSVLATDADRMREQYKEVGEAQGHEFGEGGPGARPPNFNLRVEKPKPASAAPASAAVGAAAAVATGTPVAPPPATRTSVPAGGQNGVAPQNAAAGTAPIVPRPKPPAVTGGAVQPGTTTNPTTSNGSTATGAQPAVTRPPQSGIASQNGAIGTAPVVPRPKPPAVTGGTLQPGSTTNPTTSTGSTANSVQPLTRPSSGASGQNGAPAGQRVGPDGQPVTPARPKPSATTAGTSSTAPSATGTTESQTPPRRPPPDVTSTPVPSTTTPAKPRVESTKPPVTVERDAQPTGQQPQQQRRVITNDSTINVITPAPKPKENGTGVVPRTTEPAPRPVGPPRTTGPAAAKPKPERSETPANP